MSTSKSFSNDIETRSGVPIGTPYRVEIELHADYLVSYAKDTNWEKILAEHLKMSGIYWSLTAMDLMNKLDKIGKSSVIECLKTNHFLSAHQNNFSYQSG